MLSDTELLILASLVSNELYGRQVADSVSELTNGKRRLSLAGLYTTLNRMETKGLIEGRWAEGDDDNRQNARRRYYRVSGLGVRVLQDMRQALNTATLRPVSVTG